MDDVLGCEGRKVVVTGAASGMGAATAALLVDLGAEVHALDVQSTELAGATARQVDLKDSSSIDAAEAIGFLSTPSSAPPVAGAAPRSRPGPCCS